MKKIYLLLFLITITNHQAFAWGIEIFQSTKTSITDLGKASEHQYEITKAAQQMFDNKVWSFLSDHHNITSVEELFDVIISSRQAFENQENEESFQYLLRVIDGKVIEHSLSKEEIHFDIKSVSNFENEKSLAENRKGFIIELKLKTKGCFGIDYSVHLVVEKDKLEVVTKYWLQQKIKQSKSPCFG